MNIQGNKVSDSRAEKCLNTSSTLRATRRESKNRAELKQCFESCLNVSTHKAQAISAAADSIRAIKLSDRIAKLLAD